MINLTIPTVHLNGTSRESLLLGYCDAINALREAGRKMAKSYPNGRDYYVQGNGALSKAMHEHESRIRRLAEIVMEFETITTAIR